MKFSKLLEAVSIFAGTAFARTGEQNNTMVCKISNSSAITINCYPESVTFDNPQDGIYLIKPLNVNSERESAVAKHETQNFPKDAFLTQHGSESPEDEPQDIPSMVFNISNSSTLTINKFPKDNFLTEQGSKLTKEEPQDVPYESLVQVILNDTPLTDEIIHFISQNIGSSWKLACRELGYSNNQVHQFIHKYKECGLAEVVYQILLDCFQNNPEDAKLGNVTAALWDAGEIELVCRMIDKYNR